MRFLHLGTIWVQGAMRIRKPRSLELEYVQRMMAGLLLRDPATLGEARSVQLGLGASAITRYCHGVLRLAQVRAVELNPQVIGINRQWFHLPEDDDRLQVIEADAGEWVTRDEQLRSCELLMVDLYDHEAASPVLDDEDFYRACRGLLTDGGVMTVNLFGREASFERSARRIEAAFGAGQVRMLSPTKEGNTIVIALRGAAEGQPEDQPWPDRDTLSARAVALAERTDLPARKWLRLLKPLPAPA